MRYIINNSTNPFFNIALEEYCLMHVDPGEDYFLLWQNEPSIIIGRNQNTLEEINQRFVRERGIKVVRRISGGAVITTWATWIHLHISVDPGRAINFSVLRTRLSRYLKSSVWMPCWWAKRYHHMARKYRQCSAAVSEEISATWHLLR